MAFRDSKAKGLAAIAAVYLFSGAAAYVLYRALPFADWLNLLAADIAATVLIFVFSLAFGNASVYDPYWSVFPVAALTVLAFGRDLTRLNVLHLAAFWFWGVRLTGNWAYTFENLNTQDWRYSMLQKRTGKLYPAVNLLGIHLMPTMVVYFCALPAFYAIRYRVEGSVPGCLFVLLSLCAAVLQGAADHQMHAFRKSHRGELIRTGLWTYSRHPNYLGEILMWWGIGLSVVVSVPGSGRLLLGAVINTLLFLFISIPLAEERQSRKEGFDEYKKQTRMLLPLRR